MIDQLRGAQGTAQEDGGRWARHQSANPRQLGFAKDLGDSLSVRGAAWDRAEPPGGSSLTNAEIEALETLTVQLKSWSSAGDETLARKAVAAQLSELNRRLRAARSGPLMVRAMIAAAQLAA